MVGTKPPEGATERVDLRRGVHRETAERLVGMAAHLAAPDRLLVEAVLKEGRRLPEVVEMLTPATAVGAEAVHRARRQIRRRFHQLLARMRTEEFRLVVEQKDRWPAAQRRVAVACVLQGLTQREAASRLGLSLHTVRRHHQTVLAICRSAWRGGPR
ncbi:MAG TPA: sigma factor-like helix-turn-helix DNA-binding protein [Phycisphaerales bacterium]|nr:sigma factor-like helix-turn-helix DNA-binding protein [Phycisphaerales bacterium]